MVFSGHSGLFRARVYYKTRLYQAQHWQLGEKWQGTLQTFTKYQMEKDICEHLTFFSFMQWFVFYHLQITSLQHEIMRIIKQNINGKKQQEKNTSCKNSWITITSGDENHVFCKGKHTKFARHINRYFLNTLYKIHKLECTHCKWSIPNVIQ